MANREDLVRMLEEKPLSPRESIEKMDDSELLEQYMGKHIRKCKLARKELQKRYPDMMDNIDIEKAVSSVNVDPSENQKKSGNYKKAHIKVLGLPISIENPRGSKRRGVDPNGEAWEVDMPAHYGYVKATKGADGDAVDVYIGNNLKSDSIYVIDQVDRESGKFDEHKVMIGYEDIGDAVDAYQEAFSDELGEDRIGAITDISVDEFKEWVKTGDTKSPMTFTESKEEGTENDYQ